MLRETVLALHEQLLAAFGGAPGVRDDGLLGSALARPENLFAYGTPTVFELAASSAFGLVKHHPFVNGNTRIGFAVAAVFVELDGYRFVAPEADVVLETLVLAAGELRESSYAGWIEANSVKA